MYFLGIDVGSLFVGAVLVDKNSAVVKTAYERHSGEPVNTVRDILADFPITKIVYAVRTGSGGGGLDMLGGDFIDPVVAGVEGVKQLIPDTRNIIQIGGGSFSLTRLAEDGSYQQSSINSACASGTGAFLDQQSLRLQVPPTELGERAMRYEKRPPAVATRCAVFAKSDMIHLQQEGFTVDAIAAGLCAGLGNSTVDGLLGGRALLGKTAVIGGVAINPVVVGSVREKLGVEVVVPEDPQLIGAFGAAMVAMTRYNPEEAIVVDFSFVRRDATQVRRREEKGELRPALELKLSNYPDFQWHQHWINEDGSEIAIVTPRSGKITVSFGIDIGSTSTKATFLDHDNQVVGWIYRKTAGNPIKAVQLLFKAAREMEAKGGFHFDIKGVGTTGSGRKMIGELVGADMATNEITAHATAAVFIDPEVDTIIELGGQDAKFTQLQNGMVYNSIMNYVCAAGTGSFIEEQSLKLGIPLGEYADRAMGKPCPLTSDRCTVYMERDLDLLLAKGWNKDQVAAAVLHSVRDNYLNKVVGGLYIGDHVYFQGATARNKALVAAFEVELDKEIKVSPYCHLTGSLGMCILANERIPEEKKSARFKGLAFADAEVVVDYETCELCHNRCNLSLIRSDGETLAWGLKCGRDYGEQKVKVRENPTYEWWKQRYNAWLTAGASDNGKKGGRGKIGILQSLGTYGYYPFWRTFVENLGFQSVLSSRTSEKTIHNGTEITSAEYCAPVVASHGHAVEMLADGKVDWLLVPHMLREPTASGFTDAHFCCYVQSHPGVLKAAAGLQGREKILSPVIQFNRPVAEQANSLAEGLVQLGVGESEISRALSAAKDAQAKFNKRSLELGSEVLNWIDQNNSIGLVCIGRPYNTIDAGLTLDIPRKVAAMGYPLIYQDMLPFDLNSILPEFSNMYWHYGQKILACAQYVADHPRLFGVYFTNFMCGPDSYIMTYFKEIMRRAGKPYLCLQFDGHGADAGYLTRVEAALESFHSWSKIDRPEVVVAAD